MTPTFPVAAALVGPEQVVRARAQLVRVRDGDSYLLAIDLAQTGSFELAPRYVVRLRDYNCPELSVPAGRQAKAAAEGLLGSGHILVEPKGHDRYGRSLAWVWANGVPVGPKLAEQGLAELV